MGTFSQREAAIVAANTPLRAGMPANTKAFSTCSLSRSQVVTPDASWVVYDSPMHACVRSMTAATIAPATAPNTLAYAWLLGLLPRRSNVETPSAIVMRVPMS